MKKVLLYVLLLTLGINFNAKAHDFSAIYNGKTIYYKITSSALPRTVAVTYRGSSYSSYSDEYTGAISIPDSVSYNNVTYNISSIGSDAFYNCSGLTLINIPNSVTSIGDSAFYYCYGLTSITIPNAVTLIGDNAFNSCSGLTSITIPNSITSISSYTFSYCFGLTSITIPSSVTSIGDSAFYYCSGLTSINIPNSVTSIGSSAFSRSGLTSITIPNSITSISNYAFEYCSGLTSITIPSSVTTIRNNAFSNCSGLTSITIPSFVTSIGSFAFFDCSGLTSITIPSSVTSIGEAAFCNCTSLDTFFYNAINCSTMGSSTFPVFQGCNNLSTVLIEDSVINIPNNAFKNCYRLTTIIIPNSVTSIGTSAFYQCHGLTSITIPSSVTSIGISAFSVCSGLTSITIPNSVTSIGGSTFYSCTGLTSITIPNSVTSIGSSAFYSCTGLTSITIPNSVTSIGSSAFYGCSGIDTIICNAIIPPNITLNTFSSINNNIPIRIPCSSILQYQVAPYWSSFSNFREQDSCIYSISVLSEDTTKGTVTGGGEFPFSTITITATPKPNCVFLRWNDGNVNSNRIIKATRDSVFTAWFKRIITTNISDTICQGQIYQFFNNNLTTTGSYSHTVQLSPTLDSIVNLSLKVNPRKITNINAEICQGGVYTLNGFNVSTAGLHTQNLQTTKGCDSTVNLTLIVNQPAITNLTAEICQGETYALNGFNVSTSGLYTLNLQTIKGCDSIVNLNLIVNPIYLVSYLDNICKGYEYNNYGFNFIADTSGVYTRNYQTINGCDSVFVLNLVVNPTPVIPTDLNVQVIANYIEFTWQSNGNSYIIYRNNDSLATTTMPIYLDYNVVNGQPYCYKVKAIKGDCESEFSTVVCKSYVGLNDISSNTIQTKLYPNPTSNKATLEIEGLSNEADVIVSDLLGRVIKSYKINPTNNELEIDVNGFAKGVYSIRILNDSINQTKKLIVQ